MIFLHALKTSIFLSLCSVAGKLDEPKHETEGFPPPVDFFCRSAPIGAKGEAPSDTIRLTKSPFVLGHVSLLCSTMAGRSVSDEEDGWSTGVKRLGSDSGDEEEEEELSGEAPFVKLVNEFVLLKLGLA